jgi:ANTAR domain
MTDQAVPRSLAGDNLDAFRRHRSQTPSPSSPALVRALNDVPVSDDPAVTFGGLVRACVPDFADSCAVQLSDATGPPFHATCPDGALAPDGSSPKVDHGSRPDAFLHTPFRVPSRCGYPPYAGVLTFWWTERIPTDSDAVVADLLVKHAIAVVDRERLMAALGQADDRAAQVALDAICGRTINLATGIVMHQRRLSQQAAEELLRRAAQASGGSLYTVAAQVLRAGSFDDPAPVEAVRGRVVPRRLRPVRPSPP